MKDPTPLLKRKNVIYGIPCLGNSEPGSACDKMHVGQTSQGVVKRLKNHMYDIRRENDPSKHKTALMDHFFTLNHQPDFENVSILATQSKLPKRLTSEYLHIYTNNIYNIKKDASNLAPVFCNVLDKMLVTKKRKHNEVCITNTPTTFISNTNINTNTHTPSPKRMKIV